MPFWLLIEDVQLFAGLEPDGLTGSDADFGSGAGVASDAGLAGADIKDPKTAKLDALPVGQRFFEGLENGIDRGFSLVPLEPGSLNHLVNDVLFYQGVPPSGELPDLVVIVESFSNIVNGLRLP